MRTYTLLFFFIILLTACQKNDHSSSNTNVESNSEPVVLATTDEKSLALANAVMEAMGGSERWDKTRHLSWDFFGSRKLWWDKYTGNVRIESARDSAIFLYNLNTKEGQVKIKDEVFEEADTLESLLKRAESIWINDSYWLVMPFKLLDEGVTLTYLGQDSTANDSLATEVVSLTFSEVGNTPNNKYHVHIDPNTNLVCQWDFYTNSTDSVPRFTTPWINYKTFNGLKLSGDRGGRRQLSDIAVFDSLPIEVYKSFDPVD